MLDTYLNELDAVLPSLLGEGGAPVAALTRHRLLDKPHGDLRITRVPAPDPA